MIAGYFANMEGYFRGPIKNGLVLHLDAGISTSYPGTGTTWFDLSPSGYNLTARNSAQSGWSSNGYMDFNGSTSSRQWYRNALSLTGAITIEVWFYQYTTPSVDTLLLINQNAFYHNINSSNKVTNYWYSKGSNPGYYDYTTAISNNTWYQSTTVYDTGNSNNILQYINGSLDRTVSSQATNAGNTGTGEFEIGAEYNTANSRQFNGRISIIRLYNRALSASEVTQNYQTARWRYGI